MILRLQILGLAASAFAAQPSAPDPVKAPLRDLPWGQLNFLHTTDTHGWHAGHLQQPSFSADWGDYISFVSHMKAQAAGKGVDILVVDTGDRVEGGGLYDSSKPPGKYTSDIIKHQKMDVICSGNHELYKKKTADREYEVTIPNFQGTYLASNIDILDPKTGERTALAPRYRKFKTQNLGLQILAFGFLFNFNQNYNNTFVQTVEDTIKEDWFQKAIRERDVDLILVAGHVPLRSDTGDEFTQIIKEIRQAQWDTPVQFLGGHTHIRDFRKYDASAYGIESGRYMETIGFASVDGITKKSKKDTIYSQASLKFDRRYIDNNLFSYMHHTGLNSSTFPTELGRNVSSLIATNRKALNLDDRIGCAPQNYWINEAPYPSNTSLFTLIESRILPETVLQENRTGKPRMILMNTGAIRFDVYKGPFTIDTMFSVSPFTGGFNYIKDVPYASAKRLLELLNNGNAFMSQSDSSLDPSILAPPQQMAFKSKIMPDFREDFGRASGRKQHPLAKPDLTPGFTTKDDGGDNGDDTLHSPLPFFSVPNCIQAEVAYPGGGTGPESVDLIFMDFIERWVLLALIITGQEYKPDQIEPYGNGTSFTKLMSGWIKENWDGKC